MRPGDQNGRQPRTAASILDRSLATSRTIGLTGPFADLDVERMSARLARAWTQASRLTLVPDPYASSWAHDPHTPPPITEHHDLADLSPGQMMTRLRDRPGPRSPLEILVCGKWLAVEHSHGLGDGRLTLEVIAALAGRGEQPLRERCEHTLPRDAAWRALRSLVRERPQRIKDIVGLRSANAPSEATAPDRTVEDWQAHRQTLTATMPSAQVGALREAMAATGIRMSSAAVTVALWRAAVERQGLSVDDRTQVLFDSRRYLDESLADTHGNFAVGIPLRFPPSATPVQVGERVRAATTSGWPAAILGVGEVRGKLRPPRPAPAPAARTTVPDRLRLSVSDLGPLRMLDDLDWDPDAASHHLFAYVEPDGPDAVSTLVNDLAGRRNFSSSFCSAFVAPAVIESALDQLCTDPVPIFDSLMSGP